MTEIKDKIVTLESLAAVHAYNQNAYMPKTNNVFTLINLDETYLQHHPNNFLSFILEFTNDNNEIKQIIFTNKINNNTASDITVQEFELDENGNMLLYKIYFYLENDKYAVELTVTKIILSTGERTVSSFSYDKFYGIKIV